MNNLNFKEVDLIKRIEENQELQDAFFSKISNLKWFIPLKEKGYFDADKIPAPIPANKEGYVTIPSWKAMIYLGKLTPNIPKEEKSKYIPQIIEIIQNSTRYAQKHGFSNYRVWWQFSEILLSIPTEFVKPGFLKAIQFWLSDRAEAGLVTKTIGERWLLQLVQEKTEKSLNLATRLLEILFNVEFTEKKFANDTIKESIFLADEHRMGEIQNKLSGLAGNTIGLKAVKVFQSNLEKALTELGNDRWSSIWHPAIEDHEQNKYKDSPENILLFGLRDCLKGYLDQNSDHSKKMITKLLDSPFETIKRAAIYFAGTSQNLQKTLSDRIIDSQYFSSNYRHEMWWFLKNRYPGLDDKQQEKVLRIIDEIEIRDDGVIQEGATAYHKAIWLSAIREFGDREESIYQQAISIAKTEPDHPDFSSYMTSGWRVHNSPFSVEELKSLDLDDLVLKLNNFKGTEEWESPDVEGLSKAFEELIKTEPSRYYSQLRAFYGLKLPYVYSIIKAYDELWGEKASLPWDEVWKNLVNFIESLVKSDEFWSGEHSVSEEKFVANKNWIVSAIGRLFEAGAKSDAHAFPESIHSSVENILAIIFEKQAGENFKQESDAVSIAINSPLGQCVEALINLSLRSCRLENKQNNGDHTAAWAHFRSYYDSGLKSRNCEFATLIAMYYPNFRYMSREWLIENLSTLFNQKDELKWHCAIDGLFHSNSVYEEAYKYLRDTGVLKRIIENSKFRHELKKTAVEYVAYAFINDFEKLESDDSLISILVSGKFSPLTKHLIWFLWILRKEDSAKIHEKVHQLWPLIYEKIDFKSKDGKSLASSLSQWTVFIKNIDDNSYRFLLTLARYAEYDFNSHEFLKSLSRLSNDQPIKSGEIWLEFSRNSAACYPIEPIEALLKNLVKSGKEGDRIARDVVSEYAKRGEERPRHILNSFE
ncbi:hypothetical protein [Sneathiella sp. HT1-7]|uniref:hypothetical protein n=1 Tax=Sneathiella sp. HT1-7 TaxID=2887192 RepID=UPI001D13C1E1|nr:hypothetical protein [Sneathiella sp. HT1-7]MCC3305536.1 hypothetical protein [Sneathiella sp. HT1-7]